MPRGEFIDVLQTTAIILNTLVLAYIVVKLERAFNRASENLRSVLTGQKETLDSLNTIWKRIDEIEVRIGMRSDWIPREELRTTITALSKRIDDLERGAPK